MANPLTTNVNNEPQIFDAEQQRSFGRNKIQFLTAMDGLMEGIGKECSDIGFFPHIEK